ncbi:collagen alpha-1(XVI) chain-like [Sciurus carolinensis]|uniref:collagen alpha-1(XVI) chain-like n=1 Tax=Sciurus carolinensis TaxID=30640 RepID=UPI001FB25E86|nr:collagen alpha-1(XVI) chain-like [Sciurus carolinensis]
MPTPGAQVRAAHATQRGRSPQPRFKPRFSLLHVSPGDLRGPAGTCGDLRRRQKPTSIFRSGGIWAKPGTVARPGGEGPEGRAALRPRAPWPRSAAPPAPASARPGPSGPSSHRPLRGRHRLHGRSRAVRTPAPPAASSPVPRARAGPRHGAALGGPPGADACGVRGAQGRSGLAAGGPVPLPRKREATLSAPEGLAATAGARALRSVMSGKSLGLQKSAASSTSGRATAILSRHQG